MVIIDRRRSALNGEVCFIKFQPVDILYLILDSVCIIVQLKLDFIRIVVKKELPLNLVENRLPKVYLKQPKLPHVADI